MTLVDAIACVRAVLLTGSSQKKQLTQRYRLAVHVLVTSGLCRICSL